MLDIASHHQDGKLPLTSSAGVYPYSLTVVDGSVVILTEQSMLQLNITGCTSAEFTEVTEITSLLKVVLADDATLQPSSKYE